MISASCSAWGLGAEVVATATVVAGIAEVAGTAVVVVVDAVVAGAATEAVLAGAGALVSLPPQADVARTRTPTEAALRIT